MPFYRQNFKGQWIPYADLNVGSAACTAALSLWLICSFLRSVSFAVIRVCVQQTVKYIGCIFSRTTSLYDREHCSVFILLRCCRDEPLCAAPTTRFACRPPVTQCTDSYIHTYMQHKPIYTAEYNQGICNWELTSDLRCSGSCSKNLFKIIHMTIEAIFTAIM